MKSGVAILSADADYYLMLAHILSTEGFRAHLADDIETALALIEERKVAAVIVDCKPDESLLSALSRQLRQDARTGETLVVALVSDGVPFIEVLKSGADENFIRPLKPERLLSYLNLRLGEAKYGAAVPSAAERRRLQLDADARQALADGLPVGLSPIEYRILSALMATPGRVFARQELIEAVWPAGNFVDPRTVDVHVARLRRSLQKALGSDVIRTVRGEGYAITLK